MESTGSVHDTSSHDDDPSTTILKGLVISLSRHASWVIRTPHLRADEDILRTKIERQDAHYLWPGCQEVNPHLVVQGRLQALQELHL